MLHNWYGNHIGQQACRIATGPKNCIKLLKPKGRRALQPIEIYARKYYQSRVKEELDRICKENGYDRKARFAHMKRLTREASESESDDVKHEIQEEAQALRELSAALEVRNDGTQGDSKQLSAPSQQLKVSFLFIFNHRLTAIAGPLTTCRQDVLSCLMACKAWSKMVTSSSLALWRMSTSR